MNIEKYLKALPASCETVSEYLRAARCSTVHLGFFGNRYVTVEGYSGSLGLDFLAYRYMYDFATPEMDEGQSADWYKKRANLEDEITRIYSDYTAMVENANVITRVLAGIVARFIEWNSHEWFHNAINGPTAWEWEDHATICSYWLAES